ncbi:hypothetical protein Tco_0115079 [Tanacetum coccineum]
MSKTPPTKGKRLKTSAKAAKTAKKKQPAKTSKVKGLTMLSEKFSQSIDCVSKKPSHALPEFKTINESCRRVDARKVDVLLLTGSKGLLCGILTHQDTHDVEALHEVVPGKFRYLSVVEDEDGVVVLDIEFFYTIPTSIIEGLKKYVKKTTFSPGCVDVACTSNDRFREAVSHRVIAERLSEKDIGGLKQMFKMIDAGNNGTMKLSRDPARVTPSAP